MKTHSPAPRVAIMRVIPRSVRLLAFAAVGVCLPQIAAAQYTFDDACAPPSVNEFALTQPNALILLDRSASMQNGSGEDIDGGGEDSRIKVARLSIQDVATSNHVPGECPAPSAPSCDDFRLGIGYFAGSSIDDSPDTLDSFVAVSPGEDKKGEIISSVSGIDAPGGSGTTTGDAAARIESSMTDDTRPNVAIIITDGETTGSGQQAKAVQSLCAARDRATAPVTTFIVGYGSDSAEADNSVLAAAGGSGYCCAGTSAPCDTDDRVDPCDLAPSAVYDSGNNFLQSGWDCTGSIEASGSGLKDALEGVLARERCTVDVVVPATYPTAPGAPADPEALLVKVTIPALASGELEVPWADPDAPMSDFASYLENAWGVDSATAAEYENEGWYFTDLARTRVTFTEKLCNSASVGEMTQGSTQVACACQFTGQSCTVTEGFGGFTNEQIEKMRCSQGTYQCIDGFDVCVGSDDPLPEICNGVDDNCDGFTDNLDSGEADWVAWEMSGGDAQATHCNFSNVCVCGAGPDEPVASGASLQQHVDSWTGACTCGESLAPESSPVPASTTPTEPQASCATAAAGAITPFFALLALVGFRRRRR